MSRRESLVHKISFQTWCLDNMLLDEVSDKTVFDEAKVLGDLVEELKLEVNPMEPWELTKGEESYKVELPALPMPIDVHNMLSRTLGEYDMTAVNAAMTITEEGLHEFYNEELHLFPLF